MSNGVGRRVQGVFAHRVRLDLLEAVRRDLLVRFLRPFEGYLASRDVALDDAGAVGDRWLARLGAALNALDAEMPPELQQALLDVADLTTETVHEHVLAVAKNRQLDLFKLDARTTPEDLAFEVYLDHRDLFVSAHARAQSADVRRFVEFFATDDVPLVGHDSKSKRALFAHQMGAWYRGRNRTGYCDVHVSENADDVTFVVIHGQPPRNHGAIESDDRRTRVVYVPDKHDVLVYHRKTGRLSIHAQFAIEQDFYRRTFGRVFWNDAEHFVAAPIFSADPLVEEGPAALDPGGIPGLATVALRELEVRSCGKSGGVISWRAHDLTPVLATPLGRLALAYGEVVRFELLVGLTGRSRPLAVAIKPPNALELDRRVGEEIVREYLLERRFLRLPPSASTSHAAE